MNVKEVAERLVALGLTPSEASAYVHLTMMGRCKASDLSKVLAVGRTDAYRALKHLVDRGYATATLDRPTQFEAKPPEGVFDALLADRRERFEVVKRARSDIVPVLATLRAQPAPPISKSVFRIVKGRVDIAAAVREMMARTTKTLDVVWLMDQVEATAADAALEPHLLALVARGIDVKFVVRPTRGLAAWARTNPTVAFRSCDSPRSIRCAIRDRSELLIIVARDPAGRPSAEGEIALETDSADLVAAQLTLFEELWAKGAPIRTAAADAGVDRTTSG